MFRGDSSNKLSEHAMRRNPFLDILAALVPAAERDELIRRSDAEPVAWSVILGILEFYLGGRLLLTNAIAYFQTATNVIAAQGVGHMDPRLLDSFENRVAIFWSGSLVWLAWALRPLTWLLASIPLVGIARLVAFGINQDAVGEPLLCAGLARGAAR